MSRAREAKSVVHRCPCRRSSAAIFASGGGIQVLGLVLVATGGIQPERCRAVLLVDASDRAVADEAVEARQDEHGPLAPVGAKLEVGDAETSGGREGEAERLVDDQAGVSDGVRLGDVSARRAVRWPSPDAIWQAGQEQFGLKASQGDAHVLVGAQRVLGELGNGEGQTLGIQGLGG